MGLREQVNRNPWAAAIIVVLLVTVAAGYLFRAEGPDNNTPLANPPSVVDERLTTRP